MKFFKSKSRRSKALPYVEAIPSVKQELKI
jgi:hypothetical protein